MNRRILLSGVSLFFSAAVIAGATFAFFSDTETSEGNAFKAGEIDLRVGNESYYNGVKQDGGEGEANTSWDLRDITTELFFDFHDIKPGDYGEDTISFQVDSNAIWLCADLAITMNDDTDCTATEKEDDADCGEAEEDADTDLMDGELAESLEFAFWADDGDNVYETGEGPLFGQGTADAIIGGQTYALADRDGNVWEPAASSSPAPPVQPGDPAGVPIIRYLGKAWCFGTLTMNQLPPDSTGPEVRTNNVSCSGDGLDNATQTDYLEGDISFRAVQARNNLNFDCETTGPTSTPAPPG